MLGYKVKIFELRVQRIFLLLPNIILMPDLSITNSYGSGPFDVKNMVDSDHLKEYPYCGSMLKDFKSPWDATGRAVNAELAKNLYRWVVYIKKKTFYLKSKGKQKPPKKSSCSGAVITDRYGC